MSSYLPERAYRRMKEAELNKIIHDGEVVPAIRAYLVFMNERSGAGVAPLGFNTVYLLREAAAKIEELENAR